MSRHVTSCPVMSCHVKSHVTHTLSCHVMSRHDTLESCSRIFLPSLLNSSIMAAGWQRRGFRNRGPVRESGSERRSRCGAACVATVPQGRRGGWLNLGIVSRGRLRGSCVLGVMSRACRGAVPWGLGSGRVACVACAALCHGDCWWARRVGAAVPWGMLLGVSRGCRWVAPCHGDCCWACRVGGAMPWGLLGSASSRWRCVIRIGEQGLVWAAPCRGDC